MGCSNAKMVQVDSSQAPTGSMVILNNKDRKEENLPDDKNNRLTSATSKVSKKSQDSGLGEGDTESLQSNSTTTTGRSARSGAAIQYNYYCHHLHPPSQTPQTFLSVGLVFIRDPVPGGLKRTLRNLSAQSNKIRPRENEDEVLKQLRSEGLLASQTQTAKSGISFQLIDENTTTKRAIPARLAKLEKRQKRRKLLTQQDIEQKLQKAEERRKEVEAERLEKIQAVTVKCDVQSALSNFTEHQKQVAEQVNEKVESAAEKRAKQFKEMRDKLKAKEAHAAEVRRRKHAQLMLNKEEMGEENKDSAKETSS